MHRQLVPEACNRARRRRPLRDLTPYEFACQACTDGPDGSGPNPSRHIPGPRV